MSERKRVRVHHDCRRVFRVCGAFALQCAQIVGESPTAIFEKDDHVRYAGNLMKAEVAEEADGAALRIEKDGGVPTLLLHCHEMGENFVQQSLTLMRMVDGEAAERIAAAAARRDGGVRLVEDGAGIVEVCVHAQVFLFEQGTHAFHARAVGWIDGRDHRFWFSFVSASRSIKARICGRAAVCSV